MTSEYVCPLIYMYKYVCIGIYESSPGQNMVTKVALYTLSFSLPVSLYHHSFKYMSCFIARVIIKLNFSLKYFSKYFFLWSYRYAFSYEFNEYYANFLFSTRIALPPYIHYLNLNNITESYLSDVTH